MESDTRRCSVVQHLWRLAMQCSQQNPALSRFYRSEIGKSIGDDYDLTLKYCQHCFELFSAENCRMRALTKHRKTKKQRQTRVNNKEEKNYHKIHGEFLRLPRNSNHVSVFCKKCGKHSFHTSHLRSETSNTPQSSRTTNASNVHKLVFSTPGNTSLDKDGNAISSKSRNLRQRRRIGKLKRILQHQSAGTGESSSLQDFLSSL